MQPKHATAAAAETRSHLLCTSAACTGFWPPLTVGSRHATGKLGVQSSGGTWHAVTAKAPSGASTPPSTTPYPY